MAETKIPILIVGATGNLGSLITKHCLQQPNLLVNTLVFDKNENKCLCDEVCKAGGKCHCGDLMKPESFKGVTKGIHTVICAVQGDPNLYEEGQKNLLNDAIENGVKRIVPSDFTINIWNLPEGEHKFSDCKLNFRKKVSESKIKSLHITHGIFMETYFWFVKRYGFCYFGDVNTKIDLTAQEDVAKVVSIAVSDPNREGDIFIRGSEMSVKELCEVYNMVTGEKCQPKCLGSLDDLKKKKWENKEQDLSMDMLCGFLLPLFDGRGKIKKSNAEDLGVNLTTVDEFLKSSKTKGFNYEFPIPELSKRFEEICSK